MKYTDIYKEKLPSIRIIYIQASEIYLASLTYAPIEIKNNGQVFDKHFSDIMPPNLDLIYLNDQEKLSLKSFQDEFYSYDFVNVSFKYSLWRDENGEQVFDKKKKDKDKSVDINVIREDLYLNGFVLNGEKYVRYKRSAGSAKSGSCLFIKEKLYSMMNKWSKTGLDEKKDLCFDSLTSYEAYKALSLSSIIKTIKLNPRNILFVKDFKTFVKGQKVIRVKHEKKEGLVAEETECDIENNIFDGEGLLDESIFKENNLNNKGMMLLRNRFFKCCAFNTKLQKWFKANKITSPKQLYGKTLANSIEDIVLVVSESCLKYLKMVEGGFNLENIKRWCDEVNDSLFGIVKTDKKTRFFNGDMVETTYQLMNTLQMKPKDIRVLTYPYIEYIDHIRNIKETPEFVRFYLEGELSDQENDYEDDSEGDVSEELLNYSRYSSKNKVCLELIKLDGNVKYTSLFKKRVYESIISYLALKLYNGRTLVDGTYATLFGNPYEFLNYLILNKNGVPRFNENNKKSILQEGEICTTFFEDEEDIVGSRAPHTTMGNILFAKNRRLSEIDRWFNLSDNIVVVDAINNNIQQRLSGCDYDSDTMLITNNKTICKLAQTNYDKFLVPSADYKSENREIEHLSEDYKENILLNLCKIDAGIAKNNVGQIVNLSQLLNSHLWHRYNKKRRYNYNELYKKIAILSVLSGAEIDSSKRSFGFNTTTELNRIKKYAREQGFYDEKPLFFHNISNSKDRKLKIGEIEEYLQQGKILMTTMDYLWESVFKQKLTHNRFETVSLFDVIGKGFKTEGLSKSKYKQAEAAVGAIKEAEDIIYKNNLAKIKSTNYELERNEFQISIRNCYERIKININTVEKAKFVIKKIEQMERANSLLFILLYIIMIKENELGYSLGDLLPKDRVGTPTLRRAGLGENPKYTLFDRYGYCIDEMDLLISSIFHQK